MRGRNAAVVLACAALALPATALGKGAASAKIEGEGLRGGGIAFKSDGGGDPPAGSTLARLAEGTGFYPAVFGQTPNPMEPGRPKGDLGPKYVVSYVMPGPNGEVDTLRQELYPYASGGMVTYTPPGQQFFGTEKTRGGWFRAYADLKAMLVEAGLPTSPPNASPGSGIEISWPATGITVLVVGLLGAAALFVARRRPGPLAAR